MLGGWSWTLGIKEYVEVCGLVFVTGAATWLVAAPGSQQCAAVYGPPTFNPLYPFMKSNY
jgi:hypothetical protein